MEPSALPVFVRYLVQNLPLATAEKHVSRVVADFSAMPIINVRKDRCAGRTHALLDVVLAWIVL